MKPKEDRDDLLEWSNGKVLSLNENLSQSRKKKHLYQTANLDCSDR